MKKFDWKLSIRRNLQVLNIVGLWPELDGNFKSNLYTLYSTTTLAVFIYGHNFFQTINVFFIYPDLEAISGTIFVTLSEMLTMVKSYYMLQNMNILKQLMTTINNDIFQPKNTMQKNFIESSLNFWKKVGMLLWTMSGGAIFFWSTYPILDNSIKESRLPFLAWYPYDTKISPYYEITYIYQIISVTVIASATLSIDMLIAALNVFTGAQFDILCDDLRHLHDDISLDFNAKLINCVKHHKEILKFSTKSNIFFNWIVLVQFFISAASIGITMFQLTIVTPFTSEFYSMVTFGIAIIVEIFMYCWFGNEVEIKSSNIPYAAFESNWTEASMEVKKNLIYFILRCQKPLKMSALNLFYALPGLILPCYINFMEKYDWKLTISTTILRLKILGLWPAGDDTYKANLYTLWSIFSIALLTFGHNFFQAVNIIFIFNDLQAIIATIFVTLSELLVIQKTYCIVKNMKILKQLMVTLNIARFAKNSDKFSNWIILGQFFVSATSIGLTMFQLTMVVPFSSEFFSLLAFNSSIVVEIFMYCWFGNEVEIKHRLPFLAWYPYRTDISPHYEITYVYQVFGIAFSACITSGIDSLIAALHMYVGAQFDILCDDIRHLYDPTERKSTNFKNLLKCIDHHRAILEYNMMSVFSSEAFALLAYLAAVAVQIFLYCWFGNEVEVKILRASWSYFALLNQLRNR
ncbi:7tm 6 and/or Imm37 domain containing protein [Asbolus verrucosus]|uniref:7tm 6 and/or Imm37 domain containing protein n=1 Tax=Asbolus verrucosus TaxID=1661398 RepID=A0A482W9L7_ASBVE|nr:7tm 6 and/or Imm37 domain containing protein [Asbolus verrucosus]